MHDNSKTVELLLSLTKDVGAPLAQGASLISAVATGLLGASPFVGSSLFGVVVRRRIQEKTEAWMNELALHLKHASGSEAEQALLDELDKPNAEWAHDAIDGAARAIFDDIDIACIPYLARLCAAQFEAKCVDRSDRRLLAFLRDLDNETLAAFQSLLQRGLALVQDGANAEISIFQPGSNPPMSFPEECESGWLLWIRSEGTEVYQGEAHTTYCTNDAERAVLETAARHGLIAEGVSRIGVQRNYVVNCIMLREYLWPRLRLTHDKDR